jgi:hypothetical protein
VDTSDPSTASPTAGFRAAKPLRDVFPDLHNAYDYDERF